MVMAAVLILVVAGEARAATVDISIVGVSKGFDPRAATGGIGDAFHWTNGDTIAHTSTQNAPLSLWKSGNIQPGTTFSKSIDFAGSYPYHCSIHPTTMKGTVKVPIQVSPASGAVGATFTVTVADRKAPSGFVYDVQRKKDSGAWTAWKTGTTSGAVVFKAGASGTWSFRSRLRKTKNGATSGWSPSRSVSVM